jgi:tetratricopeptide (TPR) repeat protein
LSSLTRVAQIQELRGDLDGARALYDQALKWDSPVAENLAWLRAQRGTLLFNRGDLAGAETEFRQSDAAFPGYVHALAGVARVQAAQADYESSSELYRRVVNRIPLPQYVIEYGEVLDAAGRHDDARQQYALIRAIDQLYQANGVDTDLQMSLYAADHEPDLTGWLARAQGLVQRLPTIYAADALAWTLYRTGDAAGAEASILDALRLGTREPLLFFHAGMIALARGDRARALDYLEQMHALNPRFSVYHAETAARALDQLRQGTAAA